MHKQNNKTMLCTTIDKNQIIKLELILKNQVPLDEQ
jgi:hypothetical protein